MYRKVADETNGLDPQILELMKGKGFEPLQPQSMPKPRTNKETFLSQQIQIMYNTMYNL